MRSSQYPNVEKFREGPRILWRFICPRCDCKGDGMQGSDGAAGELEAHIGGPHCRRI